MKTGIIDVGGGQRGIFAWGVLDRLLDEGVTFDLGIGVSAGSANLSSFIAGQRGRNLPFYLDYVQREEYLSPRNLRKKGCMLDVKYIYGTLSNSDGENPLDYAAFRHNPMDFLAVATQAETGKPTYFGKSSMRPNYYNVLMASSAIPYVCAVQEVDGILYYDGALSDPVPLEKAFALGCEKIVLLLSRPTGEYRSSSEDDKLAKRIEKTYPLASEALRSRADKYNNGVDLAIRETLRGRVLILSPQQTYGVDTLCKDREAMQRLYRDGYRDGALIQSFLNEPFETTVTKS